jgi:signal transduction histidine kinase
VSRLQRLLAPPVFEDEAKTHAAFLLHVILWTLVLLPVPYVLITAIATPGAAPRAALEGLAGEAANLLLLFLLRRGQVRLASSLQVAAFFVFFTVLAATGLGVRGPAYLLGHGLTIVIAGVLLGGRGALAVTLAAILVGGVFVRLDVGVAPGGPPGQSPAFFWSVSALLFSVSALVQNLAARSLRDALARARSSEAQYRRLVAELEAKNAELERFTYTVSHDLKSPLITLRGFLGYMEADAHSGNLERLTEDIERVVDATDKMRRLLEELLELSRIGRLVNPSQDVPFAEVAREAAELVRGRLEARGVAVEIAPDLPLVRGDRLRLVEAVQNLLDNAAKFMGDQQHPRVEVGARYGADPPVLFVRDNGLGVPARHRERVFRLFEKLDPASEGSGVGLALVKRIVELHGGHVWIEPGSGERGASFCLTLPLAARPS